MLKDYKRITKDAYDAIAPAYAKRDEETVPETKDVLVAIEIFSNLLSPHARVLDIGCGAGRDSRALFLHGLRVTAIDFSKHMIAIAKKKSPNNISYKVADVEHVRYPKSSFEGVWANASLHHIPRTPLKKVLKKIHDILKPGGIFFLKVKRGRGEKNVVTSRFGKPVQRYFVFYMMQQLYQLLISVGFQVIIKKTTTHAEWIDMYCRKGVTFQK